jgi:Fur family ferric uptake transcriptional regulator
MVTNIISKADWTTDWLRQRGFRVTAMRKAVVTLLEENPLPVTLLEIHRKLPMGKCDFLSVFRFMEMLEAKGLIERIPWIDGTIRCHLRDENHHRHYLICRTCQRVESVEGCALARNEHQVGAKCGYTDIAHILLYSGICPLCQKGTGGLKRPRLREATVHSCHHHPKRKALSSN